MKTAVEWLYDRFLFAGYAIPTQWKEEAKSIEKEQIIDAYEAAMERPIQNYAEVYYNMNYNQNES
jgi:hypothetical protein